MVGNGLQSQQSGGGLARITFFAAVVLTLAYASELLILGLDREVSIVVAVLASVCVLLATGRRWTPLVAVLVTTFLLFFNPFLFINLSQPITSQFFWAALFQVIASAFIIIAGIGALIQGYRAARS